MPVDGPEDAVEEALAAVRVEVLEGATQDEPVREAHRVDQAGHLLEADALKKYCDELSQRSQCSRKLSSPSASGSR